MTIDSLKLDVANMLRISYDLKGKMPSGVSI